MWRYQLAYLLEEDAGGGELLMKEVWEECRSEEERELINAELLGLSVHLRQEALESKFVILPEGES
jgi:hypothetical protein